jgi:TRAP transporter TAXI family solute receptor
VIIIKKIIFIFFITSVSLFANYTIAVEKDNKSDKFSAKLLETLTTKDLNLTTIFPEGEITPLDLINMNKADFAIVDGDKLDDIQKSMPNIRSIVALYPELLTLVIKSDSNITSLDDLKNNNIKFAAVGQNTKRVLDKIYKKLDINNSNLITVDQNQTSKMLKEDKIDAYIGLYSYPSEILSAEMNKTNIKILPIIGKQYNQLIRSHSYFLKKEILRQTYNNQQNSIITIGVKSVLVTTKHCNENIVYELSKTILDNLHKFKDINPIYKDISKKDLLEELVVPQHNGAIKAFNNMKKGDKL